MKAKIKNFQIYNYKKNKRNFKIFTTKIIKILKKIS